MVKKQKFKLVEAGDGGREEHFEGRWRSIMYFCSK
jgi:hypothetical protein